MSMAPPPSPGPSRSMGPPPSPSTHGQAAARFQEPHSPNPNAGVPPSPMSRLLTPPRFALPSVEAGQNDRELVYTTDHTSVLRSPFMPQLNHGMPDFGLSDASPAPALSPMNPGATSVVDPKVLNGARRNNAPRSRSARARTHAALSP